MVVNPRAERDFAKAFLLRSKTDDLDASVLLEFVRRLPFRSWQPPRHAALALRAFARRIAALVKIRSQEKNRLHAAEHCREMPAAIRRDIEVNLRHLKRRIQRFEEQAVDVVWEDRVLRHDLGVLTSIRGVARASAPPDPRRAPRAARRAVADPGDARRLGEGLYLRAALYMPALVTSPHERHIKAFYNQLIASGKKPKQALVAIMRKLLHSMHGMLRTGTDFDGEKFRALPQGA